MHYSLLIKVGKENKEKIQLLNLLWKGGRCSSKRTIMYAPKRQAGYDFRGTVKEEQKLIC